MSRTTVILQALLRTTFQSALHVHYYVGVCALFSWCTFVCLDKATNLEISIFYLSNHVQRMVFGRTSSLHVLPNSSRYMYSAGFFSPEPDLEYIHMCTCMLWTYLLLWWVFLLTLQWWWGVVVLSWGILMQILCSSLQLESI